MPRTQPSLPAKRTLRRPDKRRSANNNTASSVNIWYRERLPTLTLLRNSLRPSCKPLAWFRRGGTSVAG